MAISDKLIDYENYLKAVYDKLEEKGAKITVEKNLKNVPDIIEQLLPEYDGLCFTAQQDNSSVAYSLFSPLPDIKIQYSYNGRDWHDWDGTSISLMTNEKVYIRNTTTTLSKSSLAYFQFVLSGKIAASGNVNSMINFAELSDYCYYQLFLNCSSLTQAPELPATELVYACYDSMFYNCSSLTTAPELKATNLAIACYQNMFYGCTSLVKAPELPATELVKNCYYGMFYNCTLLTTIPVLPNTTLSTYCYRSMFNGCTALNISENEGTSLILDLSQFSELPEDSTRNMFANTGGTFTGTPTAGNKYYLN